MGRGPTVNIENQSAINMLRGEGCSVRDIANNLKISWSTVMYTIQRFRNTGANKDKNRSGRPRCTSKAEDQSIVLRSKRNRRLTAPEIQAQFNARHSKDISLNTIKQHLRSANLWGKVAVRKPLLRPINKQKRLKWAKEHQNWTVEDWKRVLWTDESKFELFGTRRRVYIRRSSSEKMLPECTVSTVKHGGGSVMVWG